MKQGEFGIVRGAVRSTRVLVLWTRCSTGIRWRPAIPRRKDTQRLIDLLKKHARDAAYDGYKHITMLTLSCWVVS
jgi:hypothetical protein